MALIVLVIGLLVQFNIDVPELYVNIFWALLTTILIRDCCLSVKRYRRC
jgi:hypothetical protein